MQGELIAIAKRHGYHLDKNVCRGASGTLKDLLYSKLSIDAKVVHNGYHSFLVVPDFFSKGHHLYIDPTYKQFIANKDLVATEPYILVGNYGEVMATLERLGAGQYTSTYLRNLLLDSSAPNWRSPYFEAVMRA